MVSDVLRIVVSDLDHVFKFMELFQYWWLWRAFLNLNGILKVLERGYLLKLDQQLLLLCISLLAEFDIFRFLFGILVNHLPSIHAQSLFVPLSWLIAQVHDLNLIDRGNLLKSHITLRPRCLLVDMQLVIFIYISIHADQGHS